MAGQLDNTIIYNSWGEFKSSIVHTLFPRSGYFERGIYLFRGHRQSKWELISSFDREFRSLTFAQRDDIEKELLEEFLTEAQHHGILAASEPQEVVLALAQHYGLPTRLLDWTLSPYIAAFFAFSDALIKQEFEDNYIAIWALNAKSNVWTRGATIVKPQGRNNVRLRNQLGQFTWLNYTSDTLEEYVSHFAGEPDVLRKIMIPRSEARIALSDLDIMGINHSHLFLGEEGVIRAARLRIALKYLQV